MAPFGQTHIWLHLGDRIPPALSSKRRTSRLCRAQRCSALFRFTIAGAWARSMDPPARVPAGRGQVRETRSATRSAGGRSSVQSPPHSVLCEQPHDRRCCWQAAVIIGHPTRRVWHKLGTLPHRGSSTRGKRPAPFWAADDARQTWRPTRANLEIASPSSLWSICSTCEQNDLGAKMECYRGKP